MNYSFIKSNKYTTKFTSLHLFLHLLLQVKISQDGNGHLEANGKFFNGNSREGGNTDREEEGDRAGEEKNTIHFIITALLYEAILSFYTVMIAIIR